MRKMKNTDTQGEINNLNNFKSTKELNLQFKTFSRNKMSSTDVFNFDGFYQT